MVFKIDFIEGNAVLWSKEGGEVKSKVDRSYRPRIYIDGTRNDLHRIRSWISQREGVQTTCFEDWKTDLSDSNKEKVLRVDIQSEDKVMKVVSGLKKNFRRGRFRLYHVSFSPQFRYCLQNKVDPRPEEQLEKAEIELPRHRIAKDRLEGLKFNDTEFTGSDREVINDFMREFVCVDPDLVVVNRGQVLRLLAEKLEMHGFSRGLGRVKGFSRIAGENTVSSYGKTLHSSARYNVPGRIVIDRSNSFMLGETTIQGLWDLVERSWKPLQELAWGSIGNLLTAIEVKNAFHQKDTLTPWKNWEGEKPKKASTLHKADRGGFIFTPKPEIHRNVYEVDFASMYPNIMITRNISPETVDCNCCSNSKVPELDYTICQKQKGFIPEVLRPLVDSREAYKEELRKGVEGERKEYVQGASDAIKWLLVTCFGYMGHAHASYGAIECHQAINAYARKIMKDSKEVFEEHGWKVEHGIIDSIWVSRQNEEASSIQEVCREVSEKVGIRLEEEYRFDWVAFVPRASSDADISTLNRYFGKKKNGGFKKAGIETEQSSTCRYVKEAQKEMIQAFDKGLNEEDVYTVLKEKIRRLEDGEVDPEKLVITKRTTKRLEDYSVRNRTVSALKKAEKHGIQYRPGQSINYVVIDDSRKDSGRVKLEFEDTDRYDAEFYTDLLVRAAESIVSPKGLEREEIKSEIETQKVLSLESSEWGY